MFNEKEQRLRAASKIIRSMGEKPRQVFLMHVIDGASYTNICERTGMSLEEVKQHLVSAYEAMADYKYAKAERGRYIQLLRAAQPIVIDQRNGIVFDPQTWITNNHLAACNWHEQDWTYHPRCPCDRCFALRPLEPQPCS